MTNVSMLEKLNLRLGDKITILKLDEIVEKYINDKNILTPLATGYEVDEMLKDRRYIFWMDEDENGQLPLYTIYFEIIENTNDENTIIKII